MRSRPVATYCTITSAARRRRRRVADRSARLPFWSDAKNSLMSRATQKAKESVWEREIERGSRRRRRRRTKNRWRCPIFLESIYGRDGGEANVASFAHRWGTIQEYSTVGAFLCWAVEPTSSHLWKIDVCLQFENIESSLREWKSRLLIVVTQRFTMTELVCWPRKRGRP